MWIHTSSFSCCRGKLELKNKTKDNNMMPVIELIKDGWVTWDHRIVAKPFYMNLSRPLLRLIYDILKMHMPAKQVFFDVRARTGSCTLLTKFLHNITTYAFEPDPIVSDILQSNIILNGLLGKAFVINKALGAIQKEGVLKYPKMNEDSSIIPILYSTIDNIASEKQLTKLNLVRIDTEGSELHVLEGGRKSIQQYRPLIVLEYDEQNFQRCSRSGQQLLDFLEQELQYTYISIKRFHLLCYPKQRIPMPILCTFIDHRLVLLSQYYVPKDEVRKKEIDMCFKLNATNFAFDRFVILLENQQDYDSLANVLGEKIDDHNVEIIHLNRKVCFSDIFRICNVRFSKSVCVFSNADIIFNHTACNFLKIEPGYAAVISRYEPMTDNFDNIENMRQQSILVDSPINCQDAWAFRPPLPIQVLVKTQYPPGHWHCENRLNYELHQSGVKLFNPCEEIEIFHHHKSNLDRPDVHVGISGPYVNVPPSKMNTSNAILITSWNFAANICRCSACYGRTPGRIESMDEPMLLLDTARIMYLEQIISRFPGKDLEEQSFLEIEAEREIISHWADKHQAKVITICNAHPLALPNKKGDLVPVTIADFHTPLLTLPLPSYDIVCCFHYETLDHSSWWENIRHVSKNNLIIEANETDIVAVKSFLSESFAHVEDHIQPDHSLYIGSKKTRHCFFCSINKKQYVDSQEEVLLPRKPTKREMSLLHKIACS